MAAQSLEKRLKAARHETAHQRIVCLDIADSRCSLDVLQGRCADEPDFDSPRGDVFVHVVSMGARTAPGYRWNCRSGTWSSIELPAYGRGAARQMTHLGTENAAD